MKYSNSLINKGIGVEEIHCNSKVKGVYSYGNG